MIKKLISERSELSAAGLAPVAEGGVIASVIKKWDIFWGISTTVDDGELYGPSQLTFFVCFATIIIVLGSLRFSVLIIMTDTWHFYTSLVKFVLTNKISGD